MHTQLDEGKGLVKTQWKDIRQRVKQVEPTFAKLVDALDPDHTFPLYLAYLPYGTLKGDTVSTILPKVDGGSFRLTPEEAPADILKHLGYGMASAPFGMVLEKQLEYFVSPRGSDKAIPWLIYKPGCFFPISRVLSRNDARLYEPNGVLAAAAGSRSAFVLPNIGCATNHVYLQREFNVQLPAPKNTQQHWYLFKELLNHSSIKCDWRTCLIYFSEKWVNKIHNDPAWLPVKAYLYEKAWSSTKYERSKIFFDFAFSTIQQNRNLKPNPYLTDTVRHLFAIALGDALGFTPAVNDDALPIATLQKIFTHSYRLTKYIPTIMQPSQFDFASDQDPIYYSLQIPTMLSFSPKSREVSSTLFEMRELQHIMYIFQEALADSRGLCNDTILYKVANHVKFSYYHNKQDKHSCIDLSTEMLEKDERLEFVTKGNKAPNAKFCADGKFMRGCVSIQAVD